ncbi:TRAP transporter substrate-binding protein DctP [Myxococcota bacterium]|nr:TRAP transporter substrate-binding protein DctP [Myxococcota bacterium]HQL57919.1 TRAP transporter substrate-binding protein DctP [Myxococcota bacterium]
MKTRFASLLVALALLVPGAVKAEDFTLKVATVAPEGSVWLKVMRQLAKDVEKETNGSIKFCFFAGGVLGDDKTVLEKMKYGQVHAAGLTGVGLGEVLPETRVMELPFHFRSYKQVDCVFNKLKPDFEKKFMDAGYVMLGWSDQGFVYLLSKKEIRTAEDMNGTKPWVWDVDPLAKAIFQAFKLNGVPLSLQDVFASLQSGLIDTVYISPVAGIALQWYTKLTAMVNLPIVDGAGAILLDKKVWDRMTPEQQQILKSKTEEYTKKLDRATRRLNDKSIKVLEEKGITIVTPDPEQIAAFRQKGKEAANLLVGKLFSKELLTRVQGYLAGECK